MEQLMKLEDIYLLEQKLAAEELSEKEIKKERALREKAESLREKADRKREEEQRKREDAEAEIIWLRKLLENHN